MSPKKTRRKDSKRNRRLTACEEEYKQLKCQLLQIGFICKGSLNERRLPCGNANCRCHKDPTKRHGPYYQLSWRQNGKTKSRYLSVQEADAYRTWIGNRQKLLAIIEEMHSASDRAIAILRATDPQGTSKPQSAKKNPRYR